MKTASFCLCIGMLLGTGSSISLAQTPAQTPAPATSTAPATATSCDRPDVNRAACLREQRAAKAAQRRGGLATPSDEAAARNQRARCEPLPTTEREACLRRMDGAGKVSGSVEQGGVLREHVVVEPAGGAASTAIKR